MISDNISEINTVYDTIIVLLKVKCNSQKCLKSLIIYLIIFEMRSRRVTLAPLLCSFSLIVIVVYNTCLDPVVWCWGFSVLQLVIVTLRGPSALCVMSGEASVAADPMWLVDVVTSVLQECMALGPQAAQVRSADPAQAFLIFPAGPFHIFSQLLMFKHFLSKFKH